MNFATTVREGYVNLDGEMANVTAFEGQTIRVRCDVTGFPLPRYRWLLNGHLLLTDDSRRYEPRTTVWGSLLVYRDLFCLSYGLSYNQFI